MSHDKASIETAIVLSSHSYIKTKHIKHPIINNLSSSMISLRKEAMTAQDNPVGDYC